MFRKLVSNLSFSPALVGQLGFYAKRLRKEEVTRKFGLIFTVLALVVQSFTILSPPESANAANASDFVSGGITSISQYLGIYDTNGNDLKDIYDSAGITRAEIAAAKYGTINSKGSISRGHRPHFSAAQGEKSYIYYKANGASGTIYERPLSGWDTKAYTIKNGSTYSAWVGYSAKVGWFAIMKNCGNLVTKDYLPPATKPTCPPGTIGVPPSCATPPAPASTCNNLQVAKISRTTVKLTASASVANGATISGYSFVVKDKDNKVVYSSDISSSSGSATTETITLAEAGTYSAMVVVHTSLGDKSSTSCTGPITIEKPGACPLNPNLTVEDPDCQPCLGNPDLWVKDKDCTAKVVSGKSAKNLTQNLADASTKLVNSSDKIQYTITVNNVGNLAADTPIVENLADVLEYSRLIDNGGGTYDAEAKTLTWSTVNLKPGETQTRTFLIQLLEEIPATPQGQSDKTSYDCMITNTFGNSVDLNVNCPTPKIVENIVGELPQTGASENLIFAGVLLSVVTFFYARARQMKKEIRLIRRDLNAGTI